MLRDDFLLLQLLEDGESLYKLSKAYHKKKGRRLFLRKFLLGQARDTDDALLNQLIMDKYLKIKTDNMLEKYWLWCIDFYDDMAKTIIATHHLTDALKINEFCNVLDLELGIKTVSQNEESIIEQSNSSPIIILPNDLFSETYNIPANDTVEIKLRNITSNIFTSIIAIIQDYGFSVISKECGDEEKSFKIEGAFHCQNIKNFINNVNKRTS